MSDLFESASIGAMNLRNRFVRSATYDRMAGENGEVTDAMVEIYRDLARGEVGLIISGFAFVDKRGKANKGMLGADDDALVPGLSRLARAVHDEGGAAMLQIVHCGAQRKAIEGEALPHAPSAVEDRMNGVTPEAMTVEEIARLVEQFARTARRGKEAGFDAVQMHGAHGYLLSEFLSPYTNRRDDDYGGPIENRARALFEVYDAIRAEVGADYPVTIKINTGDFDAAGLEPDDSLWVCEQLAARGIDAIELSGGVPAAKRLNPTRMRIDKPEKEAYFREHARRFKPRLSCPVILVGGLRSLEVIEEIRAEGSADFLSLCRPFISEPGLVKRWRSGDRAKARCRSCNRCFAAIRDKGRMYCMAFEDGETTR